MSVGNEMLVLCGRCSDASREIHLLISVNFRVARLYWNILKINIMMDRVFCLKRGLKIVSMAVLESKKSKMFNFE